MNTSPETLSKNARSEISNANKITDIDLLEVKYLGRKGLVNQALSQIASVSKEERTAFGTEINSVKRMITEELAKKRHILTSQSITKQTKETIDVTIPGIPPHFGHLHPITQMIEEITTVFNEMGYEILEGPDIETDHYNFEVLNIPKTHPARDLQDTFWLTNGLLPRTHTSAMQVRVMEKRTPPFKIAVPGWVYRSENEDATHAAYFHHYEGFVVGKNISFSDLKGTLTTMLKKLLGEELQVKFRASYFPYVEPCAEISVSCPHCKTKGCKACGGSGWLEIMGSGMIHPKVLENAHIDPKLYSGFAYVFGTTRLAMIKYRINDIRFFTNCDIRFLEQF